MNTNYTLMYGDTPVVKFDPEKETVLGIFSPADLPLQIRSILSDHSFSHIRKFCTSRAMLLDRIYSKEILTSAGIDDQNPIGICTACKGLSFRDNYWIKRDNEELFWKNVNLYENPFSRTLSQVAITGESKPVEIGDKIYTGELTGHGIRAKCFFRQGGQIFLAKRESPEEILAETASREIAELLNIPSTTYISTEVYGYTCSVCSLGTSPKLEMIHARDILQYFGETQMSFDSQMFSFFENIGKSDFAKMIFFDYLTLNTDRNRDNFALKRAPFKRPDGMFQLYDHDSCFKGKSLDAVYFPTGSKFTDIPPYLKDASKKFPNLFNDIASSCGKIISDLPAILNVYSLNKYTDSTIERVEDIMKELDISRSIIHETYETEGPQL